MSDHYEDDHPRCEVCSQRGCSIPRFQTGALQCFACDAGDSRPVLLVDGLWIHSGVCLDFTRESDRQAVLFAAGFEEVDRMMEGVRR